MHIFLFMLLGTIGCKSAAPKQSPESVHLSEHFAIHYTEYDKVHVMDISDSLETHYSRILDDLGVERMETVNVYFYSSPEQLREAVKNEVPDLPKWASGLATSATAIHMLSPFLGEPSNLSNLVHEFAHCVTLAINPGFGNNPRWLWESIAIYEARQFYEPSRLNYLKNGDYPSIGELNNINDLRIYELGYFLGDFIVNKWGLTKLNELIKKNGQLSMVLGVDDKEFIKSWYEFMKERHHISYN